MKAFSTLLKEEPTLYTDKKFNTKVDSIIDTKNKDKSNNKNYWFKTVYMFGGEEPEKFQLNAIKQYKNINVVLFPFKNLKYKINQASAEVTDINGKTHTFNKDLSKESLVLIRSIDKSNNEITKKISDIGYLCINKPGKGNFDKCETAELLKKHDVDQPAFCIIEKSDTKDKETFFKKLKDIYKDITPDSKDNYEFVVKIPDGSCGVGVFMCNSKEIYSIMQTCFKLKPEQTFIIQEKEECEADIRIEVLTHNDNQEVLVCIQRNKISGDFRCNAHLGASLSQIELTSEQKELALKAAKATGMIWCGVDLMHCKNGRNLVIEINRTPQNMLIYSNKENKLHFEKLFDFINKEFK